MRKLFGLALVCGLAFGGCKCSSDSSSATSSTGDDKPAATDTSKHSRSGKIDLGSRRNPSASGDTASGDGDTPKPSLPQDRRNARMAEFDTDHDGKISEEERKAARHKRAEDMLKNADKNGDGKVSTDELADGNFRRMDPATIDANKDGNVSVDELEAAIEARSKQWGAGRFGRVDRGGNMGRLRPAPPMGGGSAAPAPAPAPDSTN